MAYIPADAKWYLADIVEQIAVEDDPRHVVHTNTVLIRADSPEDAYAKAVELGTNKGVSYKIRKVNPSPSPIGTLGLESDPWRTGTRSRTHL